MTENEFNKLQEGEEVMMDGKVYTYRGFNSQNQVGMQDCETFTRFYYEVSDFLRDVLVEPNKRDKEPENDELEESPPLRIVQLNTVAYLSKSGHHVICNVALCSDGSVWKMDGENRWRELETPSR